MSLDPALIDFAQIALALVLLYLVTIVFRFSQVGRRPSRLARSYARPRAAREG